MSATDRTVRPVETKAQAVVRLAAQATANGIRIYVYDLTYYATSTSDPGALHRVTAWSCDCTGYVFHGRCQHHAALLQHIGELPSVTATSIVA